MNFLLLSGSFHSNSRSLAILNSVKTLLSGHEAQIPTLKTLPFYCEDLNKNRPQAVQKFMDQVSAADGIICCTPEYNHSVPAVIKNALDWASRPAFQSPLKDKPVTIITQAMSPVGGARAQAHMKLILDSTLSRIHLCHEMMIPAVHEAIENGAVSDPKCLERLERHLNDFIESINIGS